MRNYDLEDNSNVVRKRIVGFEAGVLHEALYLPICELSVEMESLKDFVLEMHFKVRVEAF